MKRKLIKLNKQKFTNLFKEGRRLFPKDEFSSITYLGNIKGTNMFAAKEGYSVGNMTFVHEAVWS